MYKILMVCTGNICRSPTAHGFLEHALRQNNLHPLVSVDGAGTTALHHGQQPDPRTMAVSANHGVDLSHLRSRKVTTQDYHDFDLILAMDQSHLAYMRTHAPSDTHDKIRLYLDFTSLPEGSEVPDPYYGGQEGFELVIDLVKEATDGILYILKSQLEK